MKNRLIKHVHYFYDFEVNQDSMYTFFINIFTYSIQPSYQLIYFINRTFKITPCMRKSVTAKYWGYGLFLTMNLVNNTTQLWRTDTVGLF